MEPMPCVRMLAKRKSCIGAALSQICGETENLRGHIGVSYSVCYRLSLLEERRGQADVSPSLLEVKKNDGRKRLHSFVVSLEKQKAKGEKMKKKKKATQIYERRVSHSTICYHWPF